MIIQGPQKESADSVGNPQQRQPDDSRKAYEMWKAELAAKGKTPTEAVEHYRTIGMNDYAETLACVIERMENHN